VIDDSRYWRGDDDERRAYELAEAKLIADLLTLEAVHVARMRKSRRDFVDQMILIGIVFAVNLANVFWIRQPALTWGCAACFALLSGKSWFEYWQARRYYRELLKSKPDNVARSI
jgi:hypothetical protein